jgi:hypothetical protein
MDPFHQRLARIGLEVASRFGFALAGRYALQAHGLGDRPSEDVDLFTKEIDGPLRAADVVAAAYREDGMEVSVQRADESLARLIVTDEAGRTGKVELCAEWRAHTPVCLAVGPVLHLEDAVAGKMSALFGRYLARDFIDVDLVLGDGRYTRERLADLLRERDPGYDPIVLAGALAELPHIPDDEFTPYGLDEIEIAVLRARFADWYRALMDGALRS